MSGRIEKTVFISYRRANLPWALAIYQNLTHHGYDVFFDYESINSGDFEQVILGNIMARAHFIVILTPSALERCERPDDWLRREIETALDNKRNIVPLLMEGFNFANPTIATYLSGKMELLKRYNGLNVPPDYFDDAMRRLRNQYLNITLDALLHPLSSTAQKAVQKQQLAANKVTQIDTQELTNKQRFEFKSVALGADSSYAFFYGRNGYSIQGIPEELAKTLKEENNRGSEFKSVALGPNSSYVFFYGYNGYIYRGIPDGLATLLSEKHEEGVNFKWIALGPNSSYVFLFDSNGYAYRGIPDKLAETIEEKNEAGIDFISIALGSNSSYAFLFNFNGYEISGIPKYIAETMDEKYEQGFEYKCVALSAENKALFLYGYNGYAYSGISPSLIESIEQLRE